MKPGKAVRRRKQPARNKTLELLREAGRLYKAGDFDAAQSLCSRIASRDPGNADVHQLQGLIAFSRGSYDIAASHYRRAMAISPRNPLFIYLQGKARTMSGDLTGAAESFQRAIDLDPEFVSAIEWKAIVLQRMGEDDEAGELIHPFITEQRETALMAETWARLALKKGQHDEAIEVIKRHLENDGTDQTTRETLGFLLGRALEEAGRIDEAFDAYDAANKRIAVTFDSGTHRAISQAIRKSFTRETMAALPSIQHDSGPTPVFIAGMPRSGTTLVEQIIDAHPNAVGGGELRDIDDLIAGLIDLGLYPTRISTLPEHKLRRFAGAYRKTLSRLAKQGTTVVVNKSLENYKHIGLLSVLFPDARIIHVKRDPMDTCCSCYFSHLMPARHAYASDLRALGVVYQEYQRLMDHWIATTDLPILEVGYEDLIANQESESRRVVGFCGLEWDNACLRFHDSDRVPLTLSFEQVRKPVYASSIGRAKTFSSHLKPLADGMLGQNESVR